MPHQGDISSWLPHFYDLIRPAYILNTTSFYCLYWPTLVSSGRMQSRYGMLVNWVSESKSLSHANAFRLHGLSSPRISPGRNTGAGSLSLFQGVFPTQRCSLSLLQVIFPTREWNPRLPYCGRILTSRATRESGEYWSLSLLQGIFPTQESNGFPAL